MEKFCKVSTKNSITIGKNVKVCSSFWGRFKGLMFESPSQLYDGVMIEPCNSVHTFFMKYSLDIIFIDKENSIVKVIKDIKPWRMTSFYWKASKVLEFKSGYVSHPLKKGEKLDIVCIN